MLPISSPVGWKNDDKDMAGHRGGISRWEQRCPTHRTSQGQPRELLQPLHTHSKAAALPPGSSSQRDNGRKP